MTALSGLCDICGYGNVGEYAHLDVIVCSVPSFPVSLAHCACCYRLGVFPMFCVESVMCDCEDGPDYQEGPMLSLLETIRKHGYRKVLSVADDWFLDALVWDRPVGAGPGRPIAVRELVKHFARQISEN